MLPPPILFNDSSHIAARLTALGGRTVTVASPASRSAQHCRSHHAHSYAVAFRLPQWVCNLCQHECDVPQGYQCPLDAAGLRRDRQQRPELCRGSVDFVVPKVPLLLLVCCMTIQQFVYGRHWVKEADIGRL